MLEVYELGRVLCYPIVSYVGVALAAYWVLHGKMVLLNLQIAAGSEVIRGVTMQNNVPRPPLCANCTRQGYSKFVQTIFYFKCLKDSQFVTQP